MACASTNRNPEPFLIETAAHIGTTVAHWTMPWSEAELAEMKAAWERSLRTRTQAELDEMLLTRCEDVNEYGDEDDDLMKVIEAGGDIEHAAMRGLERVWEALDWF